MISPSLSNVRGQNLLINVVEHRAAVTPSKVFASLAKTSNPRDGFDNVTYGQLLRAVDRTACFLDGCLGTSDKCSVVGWAGPPTDFRYILLAFAGMKTGHTIYLPSPRNSTEAHVALLDACQCQHFLEPEEMPLPFLHAVVDRRHINVLKLPRLESLLLYSDIADSSHQRYSHNNTFLSARYKPCLILHTSGSTGSKSAANSKTRVVVANGEWQPLSLLLSSKGTSPLLTLITISPNSAQTHTRLRNMKGCEPSCHFPTFIAVRSAQSLASVSSSTARW